MNAAIIAIGDELLIGQTVNTNASYIGEQLTLIGVDVQAGYIISDKSQDILNMLSYCQGKYDFIIITGGLGPTKDDITKVTLAKYFKVNLVSNPEVLDNVKSFFKKYKQEILAVNYLQAEVPEGCVVMMNKAGTAPGMWMEKGGSVFVSLPGVPREMRYLVSNELVPRIQENYELPFIYFHNILTQGIGESYIAEKITDIEDALPKDISLAYLPSRGMVKMRVTGRGKVQEQIKKAVDKQVDLITERISKYIFGHNNDELAQVVGNLLIKNNATIALAESLTGGSIGRELTSISGASSYFIGGVISYNPEVKIKELNVKRSSINKFNVVSEQVAIEMAKGTLSKFNSTYAIATTGLAGPDGGTESIPVGTVFIAVASIEKAYCVKFNFGGNRSDIVRRTVLSALNLLRLQLQKQLL